MQHLQCGPIKGINRPVAASCPVQGAGDASLCRKHQASPTQSFNTPTSLVPAASSCPG